MSKSKPDPREVQCPACLSQPGKPCTQPTDTGRKAVDWVHYSREAMAAEKYRRDNGAWTE